GVAAALMGKQRGLDVHVLDHNKGGPKEAIVRDLGAVYHNDASTLKHLGPDVLMECTGAATVIRDCLGAGAPDGIVCLTGVTEPGKTCDLDIGRLNRKMVLDNETVFGSVNANRRHYQMAAEALARADKRWLARLITRRGALQNWREALEPRPGDVKVVIDFAQQAIMPLPIEDYALIGDCQAAALVGRNGSIDWLCWPRFDSDPCFAALLGTAEHGHWRIAARDPEARVTRRYRPDTLILETRFECSAGAVTLVDFMPMGATNSRIVRLVVGERGRVTMSSVLVLRFGYGAIVPWVTRLDDGT